MYTRINSEIASPYISLTFWRRRRRRGRMASLLIINIITQCTSASLPIHHYVIPVSENAGAARTSRLNGHAATAATAAGDDMPRALPAIDTHRGEVAYHCQPPPHTLADTAQVVEQHQKIKVKLLNLPFLLQCAPHNNIITDTNSTRDTSVSPDRRLKQHLTL